MKEVDKQIEELHEAWKAEEKERLKPVYTESVSDGSNAQNALGGEMRLRSPWADKN